MKHEEETVHVDHLSFNSLSVEELKAECTRRRLPSTKDELIYKLIQADEAEAVAARAAAAAADDPLYECSAALAASLASAEAVDADTAARRARTAAAAEERLLDRLFEQGGRGPIAEDVASAAGVAKSSSSTIEQLPSGIVQCPGCSMAYELVPTEVKQTTMELPKGSSLSPRSASGHSGWHRFRCPSCEAVFCSSCKATPYHMGFDCDGWTSHQARPRCTFCGDASTEEIDQGTAEPRLRTFCCEEENCRERANKGCRKTLPCGHACQGPRAGRCLPCMETGCSSAEVDGGDVCNVCIEPLASAPCVQLGCGHFFHVACGEEQLKQGRTTARLTFGFMNCPICGADKALATHPDLRNFGDIPDQLRSASEVEELAIQRLRGDDLHPQQLDRESRSAGGAGSPINVQRVEAVKRALKKYSFYQCHFCRKPYFGGLVSCEPAPPAAGEAPGAAAAAMGGPAREAEAEVEERGPGDLKPDELLCGKCSLGSGGANCSKHGQEFIEHKCRWCCQKVASFFCGGIMHYCDGCHGRSTVKPCPGGTGCIFGGNHPANARNGVDEFVLGCGICRPKPGNNDG